MATPFQNNLYFLILAYEQVLFLQNFIFSFFRHHFHGIILYLIHNCAKMHQVNIYIKVTKSLSSQK